MCLYGGTEVIKQLIVASEAKLIDRLNFNLRDDTGDSCLSLAMSRGYYIEGQLKNKQAFLQNRAKLLELLIPRTNLSMCVRSKINNPLHWCLFNGDVECGMKLYKQRPMMLMEVNSNHELPFDLFFKKEIRRNFYGESVRLMRKIIVDFSEMIYNFLKAKDEEERNLMTTSDPLMKKFYSFMKRLKEAIKLNREKKTHSKG